MTVDRLKTKADDLDNWRVAKKIKPSQRGAIKIARAYGSELLCVRYREIPEGTERLTTSSQVWLPFLPRLGKSIAEIKENRPKSQSWFMTKSMDEVSNDGFKASQRHIRVTH